MLKLKYQFFKTIISSLSLTFILSLLFYAYSYVVADVDLENIFGKCIWKQETESIKNCQKKDNM